MKTNVWTLVKNSRGHSTVLFILEVDWSDPVGEADDDERSKRDVGLNNSDCREEDISGRLENGPYPAGSTESKNSISQMICLNKMHI